NDKYKTISTKHRKIVIGTNVVESSVTFNGMKYVIDSGYELHAYYDPDIDAKVIEKHLITQAQVKQRMGRVGRTEPGICYHLYTKEDYQKMKVYPEPSIQTSNIYSECLQFLRNKEINTVENLYNILNQFIEPPKKNYLDSATYQLEKLH